MNMTPEYSVGRALESAVSRIALPPESRWVPARRTNTGVLATVAVVAVAILAVIVSVQLDLIRTQRSDVGGPVDAFGTADATAWALVRGALPSDIVVLRPSWIPAEFREVGTSDCPTPVGTPIVSDNGYDFYYRSGKFIERQRPPGAPRSCAKVEIRRNFYQTSPQLTEVGVLNERGTTVHVRTGPQVLDVNGKTYQLIYLNWTEDGTSFEVSTLGLDLADAVRVLRSLEPVR